MYRKTTVGKSAIMKLKQIVCSKNFLYMMQEARKNLSLSDVTVCRRKLNLKTLRSKVVGSLWNMDRQLDAWNFIDGAENKFFNPSITSLLNMKLKTRILKKIMLRKTLGIISIDVDCITSATSRTLQQH